MRYYIYKQEHLLKMKYFIFIFCAIAIFFAANNASAATIYLEPTENGIYGPGDTFSVKVRLDNEDECVNAVNVNIKFPSDIMRAVDVGRGESIISLWINEPEINQDKGTISFSGGIPGGYCGRIKGDPGLSNVLGKLIFTVFGFTVGSPSQKIAKIDVLENSQVLLSDGLGTEAKLKVIGAEVKISENPSSANEWLAELKDDKIPPESFIAELYRDPEIFNGKYFISFSTADKQSGIDYFEVEETDINHIGFKKGTNKPSVSKRAKSPYVLEDQTLNSKIIIRAFDNAGNKRVVEYIPEKKDRQGFKINFLTVAKILAIIIAVFVLFKFLKSRKKLFSLFFILFFILSFAVFQRSYAADASLYLSPSTGVYTVGSAFSVRVMVDSGGSAINAAEGKLSFNSSELMVTGISQQGSIFNLWTVEPVFSNSDGTISFGGGTPKNFSGIGSVVTLNFKALRDSESKVNFLSGVVLAADGKGTNVIANMRSGVYTLKPKEIIPQAEYVVPFNTPKEPVVSSSSHPDFEKWYPNNTVKFLWDVPADVTAVRLLADENPISIPTVLYSFPISEKILENFEEGAWYFHIQFKNSFGWGKISHTPFKIDIEKPEYFTIKQLEKTDFLDPRMEFTLDALDKVSGIEKYEIQIGGKEPEIWKDDGSHIYKAPILDPGKHTMIIRALDWAGNYLTDSMSFDIKSLDPPVIIDYPSVLNSGGILVVRGKTLPSSNVIIWIKQKGEEPKSYNVPSWQNGEFIFIADEKPKDGIYQLWAEVIGAQGSKSVSSEIITFAVQPSGIMKIGSLAINFLSVIIPLIALAALMAFFIFYSWHKVNNFRKRIKKETFEAESALHESFGMLRSEMADSVKKLESARSKRPLTKEEEIVLKKLKDNLDEAEKIVSKEIKDIVKVK